MSLELDEHRQYLEDRARVSAFRRAINETVQPGDVVLDLGCGTGILGLLASKAGARRVYSVDEGGMAELAREIGRANRVDDKVIVIKGLSTRINLPEPVDVVVADQIGRFGFEAGVLEYFGDARRRLLKPGGRAVPCGIDLWVAPIEHGPQWRNVDFWRRRRGGMSFEPARAIAHNTGYPVHLQRRHLLGDPVQGASIDALAHGAGPIAFTRPIDVTRPGTLHGIGGWFTAQLSPNVSMSNSPLDEHRIRRRNVFFPIARPVDVSPGYRVEVSFSILPVDTIVTWKVDVYAAPSGRGGSDPIARFTHSTLRGMLISQEDLLRTNPAFVPNISVWGVARRTVLELCDGKRTLAQIEDGVLRGHPDLFATHAEAAVFAAEVITRYAR